MSLSKISFQKKAEDLKTVNDNAEWGVNQANIRM